MHHSREFGGAGGRYSRYFRRAVAPRHRHRRFSERGNYRFAGFVISARDCHSGLPHPKQREAAEKPELLLCLCFPFSQVLWRERLSLRSLVRLQRVLRIVISRGFTIPELPRAMFARAHKRRSLVRVSMPRLCAEAKAQDINPLSLIGRQQSTRNPSPTWERG